jgi:ABC-type antimicrobial peptide transport system permease subunit
VLNGIGVHVPVGVQFILMSDRLWVHLVPASVIRAILFITTVTGLAALYPSYRAARLRPITAMHHVG